MVKWCGCSNDNPSVEIVAKLFLVLTVILAYHEKLTAMCVVDILQWVVRLV